MIEKLENFLLYNVSDDWAPIGEFDGTIEKIAAEEYSRTYVLRVVEELANEGYIEFGAFPGGGRGWEPWNVGTKEAIRRISDGYNGVPGYLSIADSEIGSSEIFRARITESGRRRLRELGDPYENYGDPWADDPYLHA
ncbi:hypothetical protein ABZ894_20510 [Nocardia beijingensis]|uniref:hypothetical protein n=1 Tax=Nocardia beijingensis TaxID=95162 RepID=UPI0034117AEF